MVMQQIQNLEPWARRTLGTGLGAGFAKTMLSYQDHGYAVREGGELAILGGLTGLLFPYIADGVRTAYTNTYNATQRNPQTLRTVSRSITRNWNLLRTITPGYLIETIYSLANTPPIETMNDFANHLVTHGWRGAVIGLGISSLPLVAYGARKQIGERVYNFGHVRGWW